MPWSGTFRKSRFAWLYWLWAGTLGALCEPSLGRAPLGRQFCWLGAEYFISDCCLPLENWAPPFWCAEKQKHEVNTTLRFKAIRYLSKKKSKTLNTLNKVSRRRVATNNWSKSYFIDILQYGRFQPIISFASQHSWHSCISLQEISDVLQLLQP